MSRRQDQGPGYGRVYRTELDSAEFRALTATAQLVFLFLCSYRDNHGLAFPSQSELARLMGRSQATIRRGVAELVRERMLLVAKVPRKLGCYNVYRFPDPPPPMPPPPPPRKESA